MFQHASAKCISAGLILFWITTNFPSVLAQDSALTQRQIALDAMSRRPDDLWPRGDGHALLGEPGSPLSQKAYYEPAGSFSPSPGSFGMAVWVLDKNNHVVATSDNIPMDQIGQNYVWEKDDMMPSISSTTPYYQCVWKYDEPGSWTFSFNPADHPDYSFALSFRSTGPAGGPLTSIVWDKTRLLINHRWIVTPSSLPLAVYTGDEDEGELFTARPGGNPVQSPEGWAFARLEFRDSPLVITIQDTRPVFNSPLNHRRTVPQFSIDVPDKAFTDCINAQAANLMMGYIGRQTGPGEPVNYPLAWERDGAYSLMAMAKSGNLETARELSVYFAENDFFGGFGAEGDAPGSEINALTEVAFLIDDPEYYRWLWPHIERKLRYIDTMMNAEGNIYENYIGPIAPHLQNDLKRRQLICMKSEDGLIIGAMDLHFPALYITAISYRGLIQASRLAAKLGKPDVADQCTEKAAKLKSAWMKEFGQSKYENERNYMVSIWPTWITSKDNPFFVEKLTNEQEDTWENGVPKERPLWTYFKMAEAHQWLFCDKPEYTWQTLYYFWNNQCSPGLYTFWEGNGEENSFHGWDQYRGWLKPKYVTPHYWTASELLLLQIDMLAYFDESGNQPELVIGAGILPAWLGKKMSLENYRTKYGTISWFYNQNTLKVIIHEARAEFKVRPGVSFGKDIKLELSYD